LVEVLVGGEVKVKIGAQYADTRDPIVGALVYLQEFSKVYGDYVDVSSGTTDTRGIWTTTFRAPSVECSYRFRARLEETDEYEGDVSPSVTLRVKAE